MPAWSRRNAVHPLITLSLDKILASSARAAWTLGVSVILIVTIVPFYNALTYPIWLLIYNLPSVSSTRSYMTSALQTRERPSFRNFSSLNLPQSKTWFSSNILFDIYFGFRFHSRLIQGGCRLTFGFNLHAFRAGFGIDLMLIWDGFRLLLQQFRINAGSDDLCFVCNCLLPLFYVVLFSFDKLWNKLAEKSV